MSRIFWIILLVAPLCAQEISPEYLKLLEKDPEPAKKDAPIEPEQTKGNNDLEKILKNAQNKRSQVLKDRFTPIFEELSKRIEDSPLKLYLDAVRKVFFEGDSNPDKAFGDWKKKNFGLLEDPRLPDAADIAAGYLQGHILFLLGQEEKGISKFTRILEAFKNADPKLTEHHLLQESLKNTLLVKYYGIEEDYLKEKDRYYGAVGEIENFFVQGILPWHEKNDPKRVDELWNTAIMGISRAASSSDTKLNKFNLTENARLLTLKAESLLRIGSKDAAAQTYKYILVHFPEYPKFDEVKEKLMALSPSP